jgi:hypothetical protein
MLTRRLALVAALAFVLTARAEDPPKPDAPKDPPADTKTDDPKPDDTKTTDPAPPSSSSVSPGILAPKSNKPQMHSVGQVVIKVSKVDGSTISTKVTEMERNTNPSGTTPRKKQGTHQTQKDKDYDLADEAKVRWHELPKKADGKSYTDKEYAAMREPTGAPGYKADSSDLKAGQTVRLYLSKGNGKDDKVVVTTIVIVSQPKDSDTVSSDTPKKKKNNQ